MPNLLVRDLDPDLLERLKAQAKRNRRSVQAEVKELLKNHVALSMEEAIKRIEKFRQSLGGRKFSDSAELIREDRER
jgi:plasmid stability protein